MTVAEKMACIVWIQQMQRADIPSQRRRIKLATQRKLPHFAVGIRKRKKFRRRFFLPSHSILLKLSGNWQRYAEPAKAATAATQTPKLAAASFSCSISIP